MKKPIIAMMYDFDKTLCTKDMQEYSFIPRVNMDAVSFWQEVTKLAEKEKMDRILSYMYYMLRKANERDVPIRRRDFKKAGHHVELFQGVDSWFERINAYGKSIGVEIEHYIISSGLKEIIEGTSIADKFKKIYACEFHYNANEVADWPALTVNYTNKTQFLFRINKGVLEVFEDEPLNEFVEDIDRRIPFRNMIYIGDGLTDVPCMKLVKENGGQSIAVYTQKEKVEHLLHHRRVDFICEANYGEGSEMERLIHMILQKMKVVEALVSYNHKQRKLSI
ncbi:MAG: HAD family hydrolase [Breznakia sp.]